MADLNSYYKKLGEMSLRNNFVDPQLYEKFDVKRGLRNTDGTGVVAGLSKVSSVVGTVKTEKGVQPVEGVLKYRGIDLQELAKGIRESGQFGFEETAYLLLFGELPKKEELARFCEVFYAARKLPDAFVREAYESRRPPAPPPHDLAPLPTPGRYVARAQPLLHGSGKKRKRKGVSSGEQPCVWVWAHSIMFSCPMKPPPEVLFQMSPNFRSANWPSP